MSKRDSSLWEAVCHAEASYKNARIALISGATDIISVLRQALQRPDQRGTALRCFECLTEIQKRELFPELVRLASVGHSDIQLCRDAILSLPREWVCSRIDGEVSPLLASASEEEYRRIAELYLELDGTLLERHLDRALQHSDFEVREVAADFRPKLLSSAKTKSDRSE